MLKNTTEKGEKITHKEVAEKTKSRYKQKTTKKKDKRTREVKNHDIKLKST